jgi:hypothetical protein
MISGLKWRLSLWSRRSGRDWVEQLADLADVLTWIVNVHPNSYIDEILQ